MVERDQPYVDKYIKSYHMNDSAKLASNYNLFAKLILHWILELNWCLQQPNSVNQIKDVYVICPEISLLE